MSKPASRRPPGGAVLFYLDHVLDWTARAASALGAVLVIAMTFIVGYGVAMRYLFNRPQVWTDELCGYLLVLLVMLGVAETLRRGEHISVDLLTERLGPRAQRWVEVWGMLAVIGVAAVLLVSGWDMVSFSAMVGLYSQGYLEAPMWLPQATIPLGAALLLVVALNRLLRLILDLDKTSE